MKLYTQLSRKDDTLSGLCRQILERINLPIIEQEEFYNSLCERSSCSIDLMLKDISGENVLALSAKQLELNNIISETTFWKLAFDIYTKKFKNVLFNNDNDYKISQKTKNKWKIAFSRINVKNPNKSTFIAYILMLNNIMHAGDSNKL